MEYTIHKLREKDGIIMEFILNDTTKIYVAKMNSITPGDHFVKVEIGTIVTKDYIVSRERKKEYGALIKEDMLRVDKNTNMLQIFLDKWFDVVEVDKILPEADKEGSSKKRKSYLLVGPRRKTWTWFGYKRDFLCTSSKRKD